ncbi:MAG: GNAT family N-acetyltransferase [Vicinamibacteria bacterium]
MAATTLDSTDLHNPIWSALSSAHRSMARMNGRAARYAPDVSSLVGIRDGTPEAFADLRALVAADETVGLFTATPLTIPDGWTVRVARVIDQMVCEDVRAFSGPEPLVLGDADIPDMLALTAATQPGPFLGRTSDMGHYVGVRTPSGRLVAMAGQRLCANTFVEVSAVCTDAEFRGKGYSGTLVTYLAARIHAEGRLPILHVKTENTAKSLYEKLGFRVSRPIHVAAISPR